MPPTKSTRACTHCGLQFSPRRASSGYCSTACARKKYGGHNAKPESWWIDPRGYIQGRVLIDGVRTRVRQHRYFVEIAMGRKLAADEDVHHRDGNKTNNDLSNLEVVKHGAHATISNKGRVYKRGRKYDLSPEERKRRSDWMRSLRAKASPSASSGRNLADATPNNPLPGEIAP